MYRVQVRAAVCCTKKSASLQLYKMLVGLLLCLLLPRTAAASLCTGDSTKLPADQCKAWGKFWDSTHENSATWSCKGPTPQCTKHDPCACIPQPASSGETVCNRDRTALHKMCGAARRARASAHMLHPILCTTLRLNLPPASQRPAAPRAQQS